MVACRGYFAVFSPVLLAIAAMQAHAADARPVQPPDAWERLDQSLIWGFVNMYQPCVREFPDEEYRYKMWFFGWAGADINPDYPGCDAIFHARSKDLTTWEIYAGGDGWDTSMNPEIWVPVVWPDDKFYDEWHNGDPSVVYRGGRYYMALSSTSKTFTEPVKGHPNKMLLCIMGAVSDDGIHWTKTAQPLLIETEEAQHPEMDEGWTGDFHRPSLMWEDGKWRLWFDYWHPERGVSMGYAENTGEFAVPGGFRIMHDLAEPLLPSWPNPEVVRVGERYHTFADPNGYPPKAGGPDEGWTSRALCEAVSDDGLHWNVVGFIDPDPDAAACHVPQALVTRVDGKDWLYLFYATQRGRRDRQDLYDYRYDRIKAMRRPVERANRQ